MIDAGRMYAPGRTRRKAPTALLFLAVAAALLATLPGCRSNAGPATGTPLAAQTRTPGPATPSTPGESGAPTRTALDMQLDLIERRIGEIRGLRPEGETKRRFVDAATLAAEIGKELDKLDIREQIAREQALYRLLGLIEPDADLDRLYRGLLGSQVLGLYDPDTEEFLVLHTGGELTALAESTYAHEYVHRLQDVRFDLEELTEAANGNSDQQLALAALIEGDATVTQLGYGIRFMSRARLTELIRAPELFELPPADTPFVLLQGLEFPYNAGPLFVAALRGSSSGFDAVDQAYGTPPESSEQVMHPDKYRSGESPADATLPDVAGSLGEGWTAGDPDVLGEFLLKTWLVFLDMPDAVSAAAGWGGDAYQLLEGPGGVSALIGRIVWDRPEEDAQEFFESLGAGLDLSPVLRRVAGTDPSRAIWERDERAIGVQLGAGATGTFLAAAPRASHVETLLDSMTKP